MKHLASLLLTVSMLSACVTGRSAQRNLNPTLPEDFLVASGRVGGLQRGAIETFSPTRIDALGGEHVERWSKCGAVQAARASYQRNDDAPLTVTVIAFGDTRGAFCGFTPGRSELARPVLDLEGAFEEKGFARVWRSNYLIDVTGAFEGDARDLGRGLLRATAARLPGALKPTIPGNPMLSESSLVLGSEQIVLEGVLPTVDRQALVAEVRCQESTARNFVIEYPDAEQATAALDAYQGHALENFLEVSPYSRAGATGVRVRGEGVLNVLFASGNYLLGLTDMPGEEACDEALSDLAARAAPLGTP